MQSRKGFTLIEVMVVVAIIGILASIAVPMYSRYIQRGNLVEATQALSEYRVRMEQFYQDNRNYADAVGACGAVPPAGMQNFAAACAVANAGQTYVATATGAGSMAGFGFSINQANLRATTSLPASWGSLPADAGTRWIVK
jgi:type IV pilus assembly protein PilE